MKDEMRFKNSPTPTVGGFATPHIGGMRPAEGDEAVNDSLGTIDPADTMDTDPDDDPEAGGKGIGEKTAE